MTDALSTVPPPIPCPFVYADGRCCTGHIVRIETYKADLAWERDDGGTWHFDLRTRTHLHLFCSEKGNHAGYKRQDPRAMKYWFDQLPVEVQDLLVRLPTPRG